MSTRIGGQIRRNVYGLIAIFIAIGGTAYASNEWTGDNIVNGSLTSADYKNNNIQSQDIADGGLTATDLAQNAIPSNDNCPFPNVCFSSSKIADNAVGASEISAGAVGTSEAAGLTGADIDESTFNPQALPGPVVSYAFDDDTGGVCDSDYCTEANLSNLAPGSYLILAKITLTEAFGQIAFPAHCKVVAGADVDFASAFFQDTEGKFNGNTFMATLPMQVVHTFASTGNASIQCKDGGILGIPGDAEGSWAKITAIRLGGVS